jgi:hypothetical protein
METCLLQRSSRTACYALDSIDFVIPVQVVMLVVNDML